MRYFDEYKSKIEFKPGHIIVLCVVVIVVMVILYTYGNALLGIGIYNSDIEYFEIWITLNVAIRPQIFNGVSSRFK